MSYFWITSMLLFVLIGLVAYTRLKTFEILRQFPPIGSFAMVDGVKTHFVDQELEGDEGPNVVFLHGASSNLRDAHLAYSKRLEGRARCLFWDRPGHGWSERGNGDMDQIEGQADHLAALLDKRGVNKIILVGHSFGGAIALCFALRHPDRLDGIVLNSSVIYPWPGGINWYYNWASYPLLGFLFSETVLMPKGLRTLACVTRKVFWPSAVPEGYEEEVGAKMVLVPKRFRANARDIVHLRRSIEAQSPHYQEIGVPIKIINGKKDQVLLPWVHGERLAKDLPQANLIDLADGGHMPQQTHPEVTVQAIFDIYEGVLDVIFH